MYDHTVSAVWKLVDHLSLFILKVLERVKRFFNPMLSEKQKKRKATQNWFVTNRLYAHLVC